MSLNAKFACRLASAFSFVVALAGLTHAQTTWYVDVNQAGTGTGTALDPYRSIQYAIARPTTINNDTIVVAPGTYVENIDSLGKIITIKSANGPLATTLRPAQPGNIVYFRHNFNDVPTTLDGFTITGYLGGGGTPCAVLSVSGRLARCIVRDNPGQAIHSSYDMWLDECTITRNGTGIFVISYLGAVYMRNTITWGNQQADLSASSATALVNYCAGGLTPGGAFPNGNNNIDGDPRLWSVADGDFRLLPGSPCIDSGDPASPHDADGSRIDRGALAFDGSYAPPPTTYCTGKMNSQGCTPAIGAVGSASASSGAAFVISAANEVDNKAGLLFFGFDKRAMPFQGGVYCVMPPIKRVGVQTSGGAGACAGTFAFDMGAYIAGGTHPGLVPGALVYCQWWNRDPLEPAGFGSGLSDALRFGIAP